MKEESDCGYGEKSKNKQIQSEIDDTRSIPTKVNLAKNRLRSMGFKIS